RHRSCERRDAQCLRESDSPQAQRRADAPGLTADFRTSFPYRDPVASNRACSQTSFGAIMRSPQLQDGITQTQKSFITKTDQLMLKGERHGIWHQQEIRTGAPRTT